MRRLLSILALGTGVLFLAEDASAGSTSIRLTGRLPAAVVVPSIGATRSPFPAPVRISASFGHGCRRTIHRHSWRRGSERVWVSPVYERRFVGYDRCRRPVYQTCLVTAGYWETRCYQYCGCGARY
jgi:hypothetical protein